MTTATKKCFGCRLVKDVSEFIRRKPSGWHSRCKKCVAKRNRERYQQNAKYHKSFLHNQRRAAITRKYGLSADTFEGMVEQQAGMCAICNKPAQCVDHCHSTGDVRGLLCTKCNTGIGMLDDNPSLLKRAAEYLLKRTGVSINEL